MNKKNIFVFLMFFLTTAPVFCEEKLNAGVKFDYEENKSPEIEKIQKNLPSISKEFIDLNYSIELKPLNMLSVDSVKIKKKTKSINFLSPSFINPPDSYEISLTTGKTTGKVDSAKNLEYMLSKNPNNKELLFACSIQLKNEGQLDKALIMADKAIEIDPDFALGHFLRGDILRNQEKFKEAVDEYIYTTQINPYCADAYFNIGKILELLDNKELALEYFKTAYQINPNDTEIRDIILKYYID